MTWGVNTRMHVYWGGSELWGVYMHDRNMEDVNTRMHVYGGAVNYRGCTSMTGGVNTSMHVYWG